MTHSTTIETNTEIQGILKCTEKIFQAQEKLRRRLEQVHNIHERLSGPSPSGVHEEARRRHEPGTGNWFLDSPRYSVWKTSQDTSTKLLWLHGKPGCGKTGLASTIIEDLKNWHERPSESKVLFYYFSFADREMQTFSGLLRSLIRQMLNNEENDLCDLEFLHTSQEPLTILCLQQIFAELAIKTGPYFLIVDALDECPFRGEPGRRSQRQLVVDWLEEVVLPMNPNFRVIITSQDDSDIENAMTFFGAYNVNFETEKNNIDILKYVHSRLEKDRQLSALDEAMKEEIRVIMSMKMDGS